MRILFLLGKEIMLAYISILGIKIYNYPLMLILFSLCVCIIRKLITKVSQKQTVKGNERKQKIAQLQKESNGNQEELADKIYEYYEKTNYNPVLNFILKISVIVLDFVILMCVVATFKPITNFHIISDQSAKSIVSIYKENENSQSNKYTEIRLLKDLDKYEKQYRSAGVSDSEINTLKELKETFKIGSLETYIVPSLNEFSVQTIPCLFAFLLFAINSIWNFIYQIKRAKDIKLSDPNIMIADKVNALVAPITNIICNIIVCTFLFKVPIVISFYFIVNYGWAFADKIIKFLIQNKKREGIKFETKNCSSQGKGK